MSMTKSQLITTLMQDTGQDKTQVTQTLKALANLAQKTLSTGEPLTIPGLVKMVVKMKPATPERQGINPFTKQPITIAAKGESKKIKITPVKELKDSVQ